MTESRSSYGTLPIGVDPRHDEDGGAYIWISLEHCEAMDEKIQALDGELCNTRNDYEISEEMLKRERKWLEKSEKQRQEIGHRLHAMRQMYRRLMEQYGAEAKKEA